MAASSSTSSSLRPSEGAVPSIGPASLLADFEAQQQWGDGFGVKHDNPKVGDLDSGEGDGVQEKKESTDSAVLKGKSSVQGGDSARDDVGIVSESDEDSDEDVLSKIPACYYHPSGGSCDLSKDDRSVMVEHVKGGPLSGMNAENEEGLPKAGSVLDGSDKTSQAAVYVHGGLKAKTLGEGLSDSCNIQMEVEDVPVSTDDGFRPAVKRRVVRGKQKCPVVAVRQSTRIRRDGVPIVVKAQLRADLKDDTSVEELSVDSSGGGKFKMLGIAPCSNQGDVKGRAGKKVVRRMKQ
ncbi:hypothetical protein GUJ93_ZPchr0002g24778 [Zizania palustris]|uniref:Uncharacterized protein n=1 Tax=Zizania palustris TaxID=103762 RepID=A0A8J5SNY9_ZIZPA|nr:hypothetical protein GUJ93_ZPchr0002g24778 [Zizania palustris]